MSGIEGFPWDLYGYTNLDWLAAMIRKYDVLWVVEFVDAGKERGSLMVRCRDNEDCMRPAVFSKRKSAHKFAQEISADLPDQVLSVCKYTVQRAQTGEKP